MNGAATLSRYVLGVSRGRTWRALLLLIASSFTESASLVLLLPILEMLRSNDRGGVLDVSFGLFGLGPASAIHLALWQALAGFVAVVILSGVVNRARTLEMTTLVYQTINQLRFRVFESIAAARWHFVSSRHLSDLDHVLTGDIDRVQVAIASLFSIVQSAIFILAYILLSLFVSPGMTVIAALFGVITIVVMRPLRRRSMLHGQQLTIDRQSQYRIVSDFLVGLKITKSFAAEKRYVDQLNMVLNGMQSRGMSYSRLVANAGLSFQCLGAMLASLFVIIAYAVLRVDLTAIILLLVIYLRLSPRLSALQSSMQSFAINMSAFDAIEQTRISAWEAREAEYGSTAPETLDMVQVVEFREVGFQFAGANILENISFTLRRGTITALIGPSGSGKSTVADILMRLQEPTSGGVFIDGLRLSEISSTEWRGRVVGYVPQDSHLVAASLADNLRMADPSAGDAELWQALDMAQASDFIRLLPDGLQLLVGEGGRKFSGGERQRLSLARALVRQPDVLILDEPTSALDVHNTRLFVANVQKLKQTMAILLITHNREFMKIADQTISLDGGRIDLGANEKVGGTSLR